MKIKPVKLFMCVRVTTFGVLKQRSRFKKKVRKDLDFMTRVCVCVSRDNACVPGSWEGGERLVENRLT